MRRFVPVLGGLLLFAATCPSLSPAQTVIGLDLKPGSPVNPVNVKSHGKTPFALLCSPTFDPATVDPASITLNGAPVLKCAAEDVNADLCVDLVCRVATQALGLTCDDTEVTLVALTTLGEVLIGTDDVWPRPCNGKP
jgi:hypothetical protein